MTTHARKSFGGPGLAGIAGAVLAAVAGLAGDAHGADALLSGKKLLLTTQRLRVVSEDAGIGIGGGEGSGDDPVLHGGSVRVLSIEGDVFDATYPLPADGWRYRRRKGAVTGYAFYGSGVIRSVRVKGGELIAINGRGAVGHTLGTDPAPVRVVLTLGGRQCCMSFGGTVTTKAGVNYRATDAAAPDSCPLPYGNDSSWLCRPGMANNQCFVNSLDATVIQPDLSTTLETHAGNENQPYDCFYVYPTVDLSGTAGNHADVTEPLYVSLTLDPLLAQAARFNGLCRIFAPHYRQVTFGTFGSPNAASYLDVAYRDVLDAWRLYLRYHNGGRNVVIMGHSQGTFMTTRLLQAEFDPSAVLRSRLIAALLIGGSVTVPQGGTVGGSFQNIPLCQTPQETGCTIAYRSYGAGFPPTNNSNNIGGPAMDVACTNPAALGSGAVAVLAGTYFPTHQNQPLFQIVPDPGFGTAFVKYAGFYSGRCVKDSTNHSYLEISAAPGPGDQRLDPIPYAHPVLSPALLGTHILDYSWTTGDLLGLVQTKAAMMP